MHSRNTTSIFWILICMLLAVGSLQAQTRDRLDNRGKVFRLAFLPTNGYDPYPTYSLAISAEKPTSGFLTYISDGSREFITIATPNQSQRISLDSSKLLLRADREISNRSVLLEFEDEVTIHGINTMRWSSDAFLAQPVEATGEQYVVLSYPNTIAWDPVNKFIDRADFPSQFAVVATEDGTRISIDPTARIANRNSADPFTIVLNAGDVYLAQAVARTGLDLTGTKITSDKPVVVFGSHQRTNVPYYKTPGRDHLVEQLVPVNRWAWRFIATPHFQLPKTLTPDSNLVRITAWANDTRISIDSAEVGILQARETMELLLTQPMLIIADKPVEVAQYHHSSLDEDYIRQEPDSVGDPFMMLNVAPEHFDSLYTFHSFHSSEFFLHYINVVIPTERIGSLELDGGAPITAPFRRIPKTSYSYAQIPVKPGAHHIRARAPFGLYIYGYGPYNSYGYPGAMVFDTLFKDQKRPDFAVRDTCIGALGVAFDSGENDFGIESVRMLSSSRNVTLAQDDFPPGQDSVEFRVDLVDPYQDGWAEMVAVDTAGLDRYYNFPVKGYTVSLLGSETSTQPTLLDTLASLNGMSFCRQVTVHNYGQFPQTINGFTGHESVAGLTYSSPFPVILQPGETRDLEICFQYEGDTTLTLELSLLGECLQRPFAYLPLISGTDSLAPKIGIEPDSCGIDPLFTFYDEGRLRAGIDSVLFTELVNAEPELNPSVLPSDQATLTLRRLDARQDMIYRFRVRDAVGNLSGEVADTVGGFTLAAKNAAGTSIGVRFDEAFTYDELIYGEMACDTVYLENYGLLNLHLPGLRMLGNMQFSIPPEQLPIVLAPGERRGVLVCVTPEGMGRRIDTLAVDFGCGAVSELVEVETFVKPLLGDGKDRCGNVLAFEIGGFARRTFLATPVPNPAPGPKTTITVGLPEPEHVELVLYNAVGDEVRRLLDSDPMPAGIMTIDMEVGDLPSGAYYLRLRTSGGDVLTEQIVITN